MILVPGFLVARMCPLWRERGSRTYPQPNRGTEYQMKMSRHAAGGRGQDGQRIFLSPPVMEVIQVLCASLPCIPMVARLSSVRQAIGRGCEAGEAADALIRTGDSLEGVGLPLPSANDGWLLRDDAIEAASPGMQFIRTRRSDTPPPIPRCLQLRGGGANDLLSAMSYLLAAMCVPKPLNRANADTR